MELTKEQRRKIYEKCLEEIPEGVGLCEIIDLYFFIFYKDTYWTIRNDRGFYANHISYSFPEMEIIRPDDAEWDYFWWDEYDIDSRKEALKKMIELTWN